MDHLAGVARELAVNAIDQAIAVGGDPGVIDEAQDYLGEGEVTCTTSNMVYIYLLEILRRSV